MKKDLIEDKSFIKEKLMLGKSFLLNIKSDMASYFLLLPAMVYCLIYCYITLPYIYIAFAKYDFTKGIFHSTFVGLKNFEYFVKSQSIITVTFNTLKFNILGIFLGTALSLGLAILMNEIGRKYFVKVTQSIILFPYFISWIAVYYFIYNLFSSGNGLVNQFLKYLNMDPVRWYSTPQPWTWIITAIILWKTAGMNSVVFLAAITGLDQEMYEAAKIDGSNRWQNIRYITLPCLFPTVSILILLALGRVFYGDFGMMYALIGDNGVLYPTTDIIDTYVYRALRKTGDPSAAMAISLVQSLLGFAMVVATNAIVKRKSPDSAIF